MLEALIGAPVSQLGSVWLLSCQHLTESVQVQRYLSRNSRALVLSPHFDSSPFMHLMARNWRAAAT